MIFFQHHYGAYTA